MTVPFRRFLRVVATAACVATAVGCRGCQHEGPGATDPGVAQALSSMLSVHAHARYPDGRFPRGLETVPLDAAVKFLAPKPGAEDALAPSRRRRAVAKLAAYGLRPGISAEARRRIEAAIGILIPDPDQARRIIALAGEYQKRATVAGRETDPAEHADDANPVWIETEIGEQYALTVEAVQCWRKLQVSVPQGGKHPSAWAKVQVARSLEEVAKALDPQNWDVCSPFFPKDKTYVAKAAGGAFIPTNCVVPEGGAKPSGSAYGYPIPPPVVLFESFSCQTNGCDAWFTNLLDVTTSWAYVAALSAPQAYGVSYNFNARVCGKVVGVDEKIVTDDGWVNAVRTGPTQTDVEGSKIIGFESDLADSSVKAIFEVQFDELVGELGELACCPVS